MRGALSIAAAVALLVVEATPRAQTPGEAPPPGAGAGAQIEAGKLSKLPRQITFVEAQYPPQARAEGISTDVILLLSITAEGKVDTVGLAEPVDPPGLGFAEAAMLAAQQFVFEPAEMAGQPIAVQISYRYRFKLTSPAPSPSAVPPPTPASPRPPAPARRAVANLSGRLLERGTRLPLPGILVTVFRDDGEKPVGFEASADLQGEFRFFDLTPGEWKVLIEAPGYYPFRTTEKINVGEATAVKYYLEKGSYNPYDVTVTVAKPRKEVSRTIISATEIDKIPGTMGDPLSVVQDLPGVARAPLLSGEIIVRGSAPEDTRVNIDGADIPLVYHFGGLRSVIPVGLLDSLEFYPGNFSPMYGRATGGMVDIQIKKLQPKRIAGYIDVSLLDTGVYLEAPLGDKGGIAIAGRRSYLDLILDAAVSSDSSINLITAPRYYDYQLVANYRPTAAHDIRALFLGSDDRFEVLFKNPATVSTQLTGNDLSTATSFYRGLVTYRYVPSDSFQNMVQLSFGRELTDDSIGQLALHLNIFSVQLRDTVQRKLGHGATLSVGTDTIYSNASGLVRLPFTPQSSLPQTPDLSQILETRFSGRTDWSPALFAELELKPARGLVLLPGVRADYFWGARETVLQPRLTARYQLGRAVTLKGGVGLFSQEPDIAETDPVFGNPNLKAERAIHYSAGAEYKPRPYVTLDATVFYKDLYSLVSSTDAQIVDADGAAKPLRYDNGGTGRAYGLELIARHDFTHRFTGWLTYTLSRSERRDSGASADQLFDFDQTHILAVLGSYVLPRNWQIGGRFRYVTGDPTTPVVGAVFNAGRDQYDPTYGAVNSARVPSFQQLDLRVDKRWIYRSWILNCYLDVQNVYNHVNPEGISYSYNFRQSQVQPGLPILPILGVRADF
jgi:TonB family protein